MLRQRRSMKMSSVGWPQNGTGMYAHAQRVGMGRRRVTKRGQGSGSLRCSGRVLLAEFGLSRCCSLLYLNATHFSEMKTPTQHGEKCIGLPLSSATGVESLPPMQY